MTPSVIKWEDPPGPRRTRGNWADVAERLRKRPGQWAIVATHDDAQRSGTDASRIRSAGLAPFRPRGAFESVARHVDGEFRVYARFVGEE